MSQTDIGTALLPCIFSPGVKLVTYSGKSLIATSIQVYQRTDLTWLLYTYCTPERTRQND